jgi:hypothetical protein
MVGADDLNLHALGVGAKILNSHVRPDHRASAVFPASALLEKPTLDQSVSAFTGGAYTAKSSQEAHYGRSEQT